MIAAADGASETPVALLAMRLPTSSPLTAPSVGGAGARGATRTAVPRPVSVLWRRRTPTVPSPVVAAIPMPTPLERITLLLADSWRLREPDPPSSKRPIAPAVYWPRIRFASAIRTQFDASLQPTSIAELGLPPNDAIALWRATSASPAPLPPAPAKTNAPPLSEPNSLSSISTLSVPARAWPTKTLRPEPVECSKRMRRSRVTG